MKESKLSPYLKHPDVQRVFDQDLRNKKEAVMTDVPTRVVKVLNEMFGTCMVAEQIEPVLDRLEKAEGLVIVNAGDVSMSEVTGGFDLIE